ncbi:UspA domain-containing protein [Candidatus Desulfofervidus auxilii]|uniref:Universal stress protein n=1 Tax=Desulfofervidus auxilii TaxID=1621989 RepID=A0A7V1I4A4_DESA2|nr:universal stress protein [Candidatus Desulfofervidus auxilii]CAD7781072.1 TRAP-T-associated universal stress protein TeaD [Candidatus Methanoperedenaceae archaeon GB50]CAD7782010.1 TRAP-T-associated universal stress protein TeaD [Candidatus Methanoperedenaceae archaeon GB37]AMM42112.1 UspA domain-containing protein [Candidatus Desulfofervidus auxilii]MDL1966532.1 universal stress protein [Candidatus Desulfofervidus auxilii]CAD7783038.1 MAG: TRAP-T-associated universal stress protein TeaD [C
MGYTSILVPIDGSEASKVALEEAVEIAKRNGASIIILHVFPNRADLIEVYKISNLKSAFREEGEKLLEEACRYAAQKGISAVIRLTEGKPCEEIVKTAEAQNCDLIVMGSHGHNTLSKILLGSVTQRVLGNAPCPVMVVREKKK